MKRFYISIVFCLAAFGITSAQQNNVCVFLKDGNMLQGTLVQHSTAQGMELVIADTTSIFLPYSVIEKVSACGKSKPAPLQKERQLLAKGWYDQLVVHSFWGTTEAEETLLGFNVQYAKGYQWNDHFGVGAGASFDLYDRLFASLLLETRGQLFSDKSTPYYALRGGYTFPVSMIDENDTPTNPGWVLQPAVGVQFTGKNRSNFTMEAGFRWQYYEKEPFVWGFTEVTDKITYRRFSFSFGWRF